MIAKCITDLIKKTDKYLLFTKKLGLLMYVFFFIIFFQGKKALWRKTDIFVLVNIINIWYKGRFLRKT